MSKHNLSGMLKVTPCRMLVLMVMVLAVISGVWTWVHLGRLAMEEGKTASDLEEVIALLNTRTRWVVGKVWPQWEVNPVAACGDTPQMSYMNPHASLHSIREYRVCLEQYLDHQKDFPNHLLHFPYAAGSWLMSMMFNFLYWLCHRQPNKLGVSINMAKGSKKSLPRPMGCHETPHKVRGQEAPLLPAWSKVWPDTTDL